MMDASSPPASLTTESVALLSPLALPALAMACAGGAPVSTLFDLLSVGAFRSTVHGRLLRANPALVRFHGAASEAELLAGAGGEVEGFYVEPRRREWLMQRLARDGQVTGFVSEVFRGRKRERVWVTENVHVVHDAQGQVLYLEGTLEEITDRVRQQAELARSEQTLRLVTDHVPGAVFRLHFGADGQRRIDYCSGGVRELLGCTPEQMVADPTAFERLIHPEDAARVGQAIARSVHAQQPLAVELRVCLDGGQQKWVQVSSQPAPSVEGEMVRIGVMMDITGRKEAEALRIERDRAEGADRAKTELLSRVSHELRTPLNAVLGFAQLLEVDPTLGARQRTWTEQILASGRHLLELVDEVLDLSAAQSGRLDMQLRPVSLPAVVAESWAMLAVAAERAGLAYVETGTEVSTWVLADGRRLKQVVSNLLSNAVKYNRAHGRIELHLRPEGDGVELSISDSGAGLTTDQVARLFRPFERLGAQHSAVPGTGLGLALTRQLVESMGGRIHAESTPGVGTTFRLWLPRAPQPSGH